MTNPYRALLAQPEAESTATQLAARPLLERVARMGDRIGQHTIGEVVAISDQAAGWLEANPPGQPVAIEPRGCPTPGACSCVETGAQSEPEGLTDEQIMELMPQQMRDDLSHAARAIAGFNPANIKAAGAMRIILNRHAVDHARAAIARWGRQPEPPAEGEVGELVEWLHGQDGGREKRAIHSRIAALLQQQAAPAPVVVPVPVAERLPGEGDCTAQGWCWVFYRGFPSWTLEPPFGQDGKHTGYTHWLSANALPTPSNDS